MASTPSSSVFNLNKMNQDSYGQYIEVVFGSEPKTLKDIQNAVTSWQDDVPHQAPTMFGAPDNIILPVRFMDEETKARIDASATPNRTPSLLLFSQFIQEINIDQTYSPTMNTNEFGQRTIANIEDPSDLPITLIDDVTRKPYDHVGGSLNRLVYKLRPMYNGVDDRPVKKEESRKGKGLAKKEENDDPMSDDIYETHRDTAEEAHHDGEETPPLLEHEYQGNARRTRNSCSRSVETQTA